MKKLITILLLAVLVEGVLLYLRRDQPQEIDSRELVVQALRSIPRSFYVAITTESLAVSQDDSGTWILGVREGEGTIVVKTHYGFDLSKVDPSHVRVSGSRAIVTLPPTEIFDTSVDLATWHFVGKQSGLNLMADALSGRSLEARLLTSVRLPAQDDGAQASEVQRSMMLRRLNEHSRDLFRGTGLEVEFE